MYIGMITCNYFMRIYNYQTPENFSWPVMCAKYREEFKYDDFMKLADEIRKMGYTNLEIWEPTFSYKVYSEEQAVKLAEDLKSMGFETLAYCIGGWGVNDIPDIEAAYRFARALGAKVVTGCILKDGYEKTLAEVERCCKKYDMLYAIENHPEPNFEKPEDIRKAIDEFECIGANLDTGIYNMQGYDVMEAARLLRDKTYHVHFKDTVVGGEGCLPIGDGDAPLAELLRYLRDTDYQYMISVEFEHHEDPAPGLIKSMDYIKNALR
ncbi:MAG: sugar phosphate isomerase/epimerase [Clostridiales bacterium]|jgi:sugar phosphate isomerase/epimerase|nr:sugar phosphate isomerase/epimerase [Clostridiales bacterium]